MISPSIDPAAEMADAVASYHRDGDVAALLSRLDAIAASTDLDALMAAAEPYRGIPEVAGPVYERVVTARPGDAQAMVILANAYWLTGRGSQVVADLAGRAIEADPTNRGAWHLWALSEPHLRGRVSRWRQVSERFPADELAKATLADNAASLAGAEHDAEALATAIRTYEALLATAVRDDQRAALRHAIHTLRGWRL